MAFAARQHAHTPSPGSRSITIRSLLGQKTKTVRKTMILRTVLSYFSTKWPILWTTYQFRWSFSTKLPILWTTYQFRWSFSTKLPILWTTYQFRWSFSTKWPHSVDNLPVPVCFLHQTAHFVDNLPVPVCFFHQTAHFVDNSRFISVSVPRDSGLNRRSLCGFSLRPVCFADSRLRQSSRYASLHSSDGPGIGMTTMNICLSGPGRNI